MNQSMVRLGNNEVLKTLTKTLTFMDADTNANAGASTIALHEHCSGKLKTLLIQTRVEVLRPSQLIGVMSSWSVYQSTLVFGRLNPLSG